MLAILNSLNANNFSIFQPILMILVSKFVVYRALSDKLYESLGLVSPLKTLLDLGPNPDGPKISQALFQTFIFQNDSLCSAREERLYPCKVWHASWTNDFNA